MSSKTTIIATTILDRQINVVLLLPRQVMRSDR